MASPRRRRTFSFWLPLVAVFVVYFGLVLWAGSSLCLVRAMTGLPCPGCGLTHAAIAAAHGDLGAAIRNHAMIFLVPFVAGLAAMDRLWLRRESFRRVCNVFYIVVAAVMMVYFVIRLVMFFPRGPYPMTWDRKNIPNKIVTSVRDSGAGRFFKSAD